MNPCEELSSVFDLDSTLAGYQESIEEKLSLMRSPAEEQWDWKNNWKEDAWPNWLKARIKMVKSSVGFWRNLPKLQAGFDILEISKMHGFVSEVLTRGPKWHPPAFQEKVEWCAEHVPDLNVNLVRNKSRHYAKILVDDWPDYFLPWLNVRPRGWAIAVEQPWNKHVNHPRLVIYNGKNLLDVANVFANVRKVTLGE